MQLLRLGKITDNKYMQTVFWQSAFWGRKSAGLEYTAYSANNSSHAERDSLICGINKVEF